MTLNKTFPIRGYLLVKPEEAVKQTESGIIMASNVKWERPQTGEVIKVGDDLLTESGAKLPSPVTVGANVIFKKWGGNEIKIDDVEYFFIRFDDILGVC
jgi:chaperonin GroES